MKVKPEIPHRMVPAGLAAAVSMRARSAVLLTEGWITPLGTIGDINFWSARGHVKEHTDECHDEWSYLLILQASDAVLKMRGKSPLAVKVGMLIELRSHTPHCLVQPKGGIFLWAAVDRAARLALDEAEAIFAKADLEKPLWD